MSNTDHANELQQQIDDLKSKVESATGAEKVGIMQKIHELETEKDALLNDAKTVEGDVEKAAGDLHV